MRSVALHRPALVVALAYLALLGLASAATAVEKAPSRYARAAYPSVSGERRDENDAPEWARWLDRDPKDVNVFEVQREYQQWYTSEARGEAAVAGDEAAEKGAERDDPWVNRYLRWRRSVERYVQPDGSIDFARPGGPTPLVEAARIAPGTQSTTWNYVGPITTNWAADERPAHDAKVSQANVYAFDVARSDHNVLYCGTETGVVSKSTDKGLHWSPAGEFYSNFSSAVGGIAIHPNNPNIVFVANGTGVHQTTNGGASWTPILSVAGLSPNFIRINPAKPDTIFLGTATGMVPHTTASGWGSGLGRPAYDLAFKPGDAGIVYFLARNAAGDSVDFLKSTNSGNTFTKRLGGWVGDVIPGSYGGARMTVTSADPNRIYVALLTPNGPRVLRSGDSGEHWTIVAANSPLDSLSECTSTAGPLAMTNGQGFYDLSIAASDTDANQLVVGTTGLYRSTDGGLTYVTVGYPCTDDYMHADIQEMRSIGGDAWVASDGGMNYSSDFWATKTNVSVRNEGLRGTEIWGFAQGWNEDAIAGGRYHNGAVGYWYEGYPSCYTIVVGVGEPATGYINPANSRMVYWGLQFGDGSVGGQRVVFPETPDQPSVSTVIPAVPYQSAERGDGLYIGMDTGDQEWDPRYSNVYWIGQKRKLAVTMNNGASFPNSLPFSDTTSIGQHIRISRSNPLVIYATVWTQTQGILRKSTNGGGNWGFSTNPMGPTPEQRKVSTIALSGTDANVLWWCFRNGPDGNKVFKTTDGGATWTNWTTPTLNGVQLQDMVHQLGTNGGIYLVGDYGAVFYRNNTMADWVTYNTGLPPQLTTHMVRAGIQYKNKKLRLATASGFWQVDLFENSTTTLVQPMVDKQTVSGPCDTLQFESYSVVNGPATYQWSFSPQPLWVSDSNARNPRVVLGPTPGAYDVTLRITDSNGVTTRTIPAMVSSSFVPSVQWASSILGFSSQYDANTYSAVQALGAPDAYPAYGDLVAVWASLTADDQREYLDLQFATPAPVNFVEVVETWNPGSLDKVSVRNRNTGVYQEVWSAVAAPAPPVSRKFDVVFPEPQYLVDAVRVEFNSPAVPGWNEIDAVGIGRCGCAPSLVDVAPALPAPATSGLEWARPNPFTHATRVGFALARAGKVTLDVFSVTGQKVVTLVDSELAAGQHSAEWNGRDASGELTPSGIYYAHLVAPGARATIRLARIR